MPDVVAGYGVKHGGIEWIGVSISDEEAACQEAERRGAAEQVTHLPSTPAQLS